MRKATFAPFTLCWHICALHQLVDEIDSSVVLLIVHQMPNHQITIGQKPEKYSNVFSEIGKSLRFLYFLVKWHANANAFSLPLGDIILAQLAICPFYTRSK